MTWLFIINIKCFLIPALQYGWNQQTLIFTPYKMDTIQLLTLWGGQCMFLSTWWKCNKFKARYMLQLWIGQIHVDLSSYNQ
jgi:hypothetical protein